jgi:hypothetical protein
MPTTIFHLTEDAWCELGEHLDIQSIISTALTCKGLRHIKNNQMLWSIKMNQTWPGMQAATSVTTGYPSAYRTAAAAACRVGQSPDGSAQLCLA